MFAEADLPLVNPDCARCMSEGIISASLEATILESILESTLSNDMGQYEPGSCGSFGYELNVG